MNADTLVKKNHQQKTPYDLAKEYKHTSLIQFFEEQPIIQQQLEVQSIMLHNENIKSLELQLSKQAEQLEHLQLALESEKNQHEQDKVQFDSKINELNNKVKTEQQFFDGVLLHAAEGGNVKKINSSLDFDANIKTKNDKGQTALHLAVLNNHHDTSAFILEKEPTLFMVADNMDFTPIQQMANAGQIEMLDWLYQKGKNIPEFADKQEEFDKVYLVATPETRFFLANKRLLEFAKTGKIEGVKDALSKGANINVKASDGETALHKAVYNKYNDIAHLLLEQGADPTIRNNIQVDISKYHETALDYAKLVDDTSLISIIATPFLICAAHHGMQADILMALSAGANLVGVDSNGQTALHKVTLAGNIEGIKLLLKKHAEAKVDINIADKDGNTPYQLAVKLGVRIKTNAGEKNLEIYMAEKFGAYKKEIKLQEKLTKLSNEPLSFIASIGQSEGGSPSASLNNDQILHPSVPDQSQLAYFKAGK